MSLATLFGKLQEHEMELQRLNQNEESDKRKRRIALKSHPPSNKIVTTRTRMMKKMILKKSKTKAKE